MAGGDHWGCRQDVGSVQAVLPTADLAARLVAEYRTALAGLATLAGGAEPAA